ncbi:metallophosphoesterase [Magnetovibrio sp. PR-2]|uniref:metallophosphoesterase family protein n=1 Tax=Magnetovibrio sp. PR-2 TaxID=3120356 RepID=UPI002FCE1EE3
MSELISKFDNAKQLLAGVPEAKDNIQTVLEYLKACETELINTFNHLEANDGSPEGLQLGDEIELEFGAFLYHLFNPAAEHKALLAGEHVFGVVSDAVLSVAEDLGIAPALTQDLLDKMMASKWLVLPGGEILSITKYNQLDPMWTITGIYYVINTIDPKLYYGPYPEPQDAYVGTVDASQETLNMAVIGDWGTGVYGDFYDNQGPAVAVMNAVRDLGPDMAVHLGDVYYAGTDDRLPLHEEKRFLLDQWKTGLTAAGTNFAINSNHEMYGAVQGLMGVALAPDTVFGHQNRAPYFAVNYGKWVIIGLDSARFDPSTFYMQGALGDAENTQQKRFVASLGDLSDKKVLVMTHHNPIDYKGETLVQNKKAGQPLWDGMKEVIGRTPDVWYWGHLHLGVAYNSKTVVGSDGTLCRCVGHSAIPYANAYGINTNNVDYYAHTSLADGTNQVQNGFAMLSLHADGTFDETFYECTNEGGRTAAWTKSH